MTSTIAFSGPGGRYEVTLPTDAISLEDSALSVVAHGIASSWNVEVDETDAQGTREISGLAGDGSGLWFVLSIGPTSQISYWGDRKLIRIDIQVS